MPWTNRGPARCRHTPRSRRRRRAPTTIWRTGRSRAAAGGERRRRRRLGVVVGDGDVDVEAVAAGTRLVHLLEPERRTDAQRIDEVAALPRGSRALPPRTAGCGSASMVSIAISTACGAPGSAVAPALGGERRDRPGQFDVERRQPAGGVRRQRNAHDVRVADVDVGVVPRRLGRVGDRPRRARPRPGTSRRGTRRGWRRGRTASRRVRGRRTALR